MVNFQFIQYDPEAVDEGSIDGSSESDFDGEQHSQLLKLPAEILRQIASNLDIEACKALRGVCICFRQIATESMLTKHTLKLCGNSLNRHLGLAAEPNSSRLVRHLVLETRIDPHAWNHLPYRERIPDLLYMSYPGWVNPWLQAIMYNLQQAFSLLKVVDLRFGNYTEYPQHVSLGLDIMLVSHESRMIWLPELFTALRRRLQSPHVQPVRVLTISNMTSYPDHVITDTEEFKMVLKTLRQLHILIAPARLCFKPPPETFPEFETMEVFQWRKLCKFWITPIGNQLTSLSVYQNQFWGAIPCLEMPKLPTLQTLALGRYTFGHKSQINWLASLENLERLILDDCPIIWLMLVGPEFEEGLAAGLADWKKFPPGLDKDGEGTVMILWEDALRWSGVFELLGKRLNKLKSVSIGQGDWGTGLHKDEAFLDRYHLTNSLDKDRYVVFDGYSVEDPALDEVETPINMDYAWRRPSNQGRFIIYDLDDTIPEAEFLSLNGLVVNRDSTIAMPTSVRDGDQAAWDTLMRIVRERHSGL